MTGAVSLDHCTVVAALEAKQNRQLGKSIMSDERYAQLQRTLIESAKQHLVELTGAWRCPTAWTAMRVFLRPGGN